MSSPKRHVLISVVFTIKGRNRRRRRDYFPFKGPVVLEVKRVVLSPSFVFLLKST